MAQADTARRFGRQADREAGFSLVESLLSLVLMLVLTGAVFSLVNPSATASQTQPEAMDMQQRARVASDLLFRDLFMAGAGVYAGPQTGALTNFFAPIIPRIMGKNGDPYTTVKSDAVTISYIPNTYSQTTIRDPMPQPSSELKVEDMANCPKGEELCGFKDGMTLLICARMATRASASECGWRWKKGWRSSATSSSWSSGSAPAASPSVGTSPPWSESSSACRPRPRSGAGAASWPDAAVARA
jgi:type II secretory pathway pseudopilin PulG